MGRLREGGKGPPEVTGMTQVLIFLLGHPWPPWPQACAGVFLLKGPLLEAGFRGSEERAMSGLAASEATRSRVQKRGPGSTDTLPSDPENKAVWQDCDELCSTGKQSGQSSNLKNIHIWREIKSKPQSSSFCTVFTIPPRPLVRGKETLSL